MSRAITRNTMCIDLFTANDLDFCCSKCHSILDPLTTNKPKLKVSNRFKSERQKCEQQWDILYATNAPKTLRHK